MNLKIVNKTLKVSNQEQRAENKQLRLDLKYAKAYNKQLVKRIDYFAEWKAKKLEALAHA